MRFFFVSLLIIMYLTISMTEVSLICSKCELLSQQKSSSQKMIDRIGHFSSIFVIDFPEYRILIQGESVIGL